MGTLELDLHVIILVHRQPTEERLSPLVMLDLIVIPQRHVAQLLLLSQDVHWGQRRGKARLERASTGAGIICHPLGNGARDADFA